MIKLTPRLELCASLCPKGRRVIDVGCDHGYMAIRLVEDGRVERALACDLRAGPLANAAENIRQRGLENRIETVLTDGLEGISGGEGDVITICGMGGDTIAQIISRVPWAGQGAIVAQPMTKGEHLRAFLAENGYNIYREPLVYEDRRLYCAMLIKKGEYRGESHMLFSHAMESEPLFPHYLRLCLAKCRKRYEGARRPEDGRILQMLEERIRCL